jgi:hypothetical protein
MTEAEIVAARTDKKIKRKRVTVESISLPNPKTRYIVSFLKRRRLNDNASLPFGYK